MNLLSDAFAYHACAIATEGNYRKLSALKDREGNFQSLWNSLKSNSTIVKEAESSWNRFQSLGGRLILREDFEFPPLLREISWPPFGLYVLGKLPLQGQQAIAIVGTRKSTASGKETAYQFGRALAERGVGIVSGLALGVDAAAHAGALEGNGYTIAVLATGVDHIYPHYNAGLAKRILEKGGALLSEYPPGAPALPYRFLERNRIVSGLSTGTLVIEAPERSGSLATARFAIEQNRSVFVVPGPISHPNFAGSHELLRNGAELVTLPAHILESLGFESMPVEAIDAKGETEEEECVLRALSASTRPLDIDKIIELTNLETHIATQTVSFLLVRNLLAETETGYVIKKTI